MEPTGWMLQMMGAVGVIVLSGTALTPLTATATFPAAVNGNVAFVAICDANVGQAVYSLNPSGTPPPTYSCPGGTAPNSNQSSAGSTDSMPFFSADGGSLLFASNRQGNDAIFEVPYPAAVSGPPGSQADGATQVTFPTAGGANFNDYAPTVSADGSTLAFIRCDSASTNCRLDVQTPVVGGTPSAVTTTALLAGPDAVSGAADRPEIDPVEASRVLYVGADSHLHLVSLTGAFAERDLSSESGVAGNADEYPDWNPTGTRIIFDSNRTGGHKVFTMNPTANPATATALWGAGDPGTEIEPVYAPTTPGPTRYVWTKLGHGSNIVLDMGTQVGGAMMLANLTANRTNNSQPAWQAIPLPATTPEAPTALLLPLTGGVLLVGAVLLGRRRRAGTAALARSAT